MFGVKLISETKVAHSISATNKQDIYELFLAVFVKRGHVHSLSYWSTNSFLMSGVAPGLDFKKATQKWAIFNVEGKAWKTSESLAESITIITKSCVSIEHSYE